MLKALLTRQKYNINVKTIYIKTHFPLRLDYILYIDVHKKTIQFKVNNVGFTDGKILVSECNLFFKKLLNINKKFIDNLFVKYHNKKRITNLQIIRCYDCFICLEDFRNLCYGFIKNLINDDSPYKNNKIGDFGFLKGKTKPRRLHFIRLSKKHPLILEYISTHRYNKRDPTMISFIDMKKYKYLIDLPGHTYSTKIYSYLHCKRVIFRVKCRKQTHFYWEKQLKPNVHYIEIKEDFSNLISQHKYIEDNPDIYAKIVANCQELINNKITQQHLHEHFLNFLFRRCLQ